MNKKFVATLLFLTLAGCKSSAPPASRFRLDAFKRLPAARLASWQVDAASLRRSLIPLPKEMDGADLVSGILTPDKRIVRVSEAGPSAGSQDAGPLPDVTGIPDTAQFWLAADPKAFEFDASHPGSHPFVLTFGKTTVELPSDLVTRSTRIIAWGNASAAGADMTLDAEYPEASDAARLASSLTAVLRMASEVKSTVEARDGHIVIKASIGPVDAGRLLMRWTQ